MAKFIELTDRGSGKKSLININEIIAIHEEEGGYACVEIRMYGKAKFSFCLPCAETYTAVYNELVVCECVLFGGLTDDH